jgi:RNA polymerase sigma factor (sigma-70 family)
MASGQLGAVLRRLLLRTDGNAWPSILDGGDRQLLERFVGDEDEAAFAALVARHGQLVLGVCRSVLRQQQDAEDAFQATFLVLARMASSIRKPDSLACWLHGVALRTALKERRAMATRRRNTARIIARSASKGLSTRELSPEQPVSEAALREVQMILHEEVERLPEKNRIPFVLCCLEGKSRAEAARQLGWKEGTVSGRIAQARELLKTRLERRGVGLPAALAVTASTPALASAALPAAMCSNVVRASVAFAAGSLPESVSAETVTLAKGVIHAMITTKLKALTGIALLLAVLMSGPGLLAYTALPWGQVGILPRQPEAAAVPWRQGANLPPRYTDAFGDPLPSGMIVRMGSGRLRHAGPVHKLAFTASGKLASAGADGTVRLWDGNSGKELLRLAAGESWVRDLAVSRDEKLLAAGGDAVYIWDAGTGKRLHRLEPGKTSSYSVALSPDGTRLVSGDGDDAFRLWDTASGKLVRTFSAGPTFIPPVTFSHAGKILATGQRDVIWLWDAATGTERRQLRGHEQIIYALAFSPDDKILASGSVDKTIRLWDPISGALIRTLKGHTSQVLSLAFSPDGKKLASAGGDNLVRVWEVASGKEQLQIRQGLGEHSGNVNGVAFSADSATLAAGSNHSRIRLWDAATGKEKQDARGHEAYIASLAFTPDGKQLVTGCFAGAVIGWDARTGKELRTYARDCHRVFAIAMSPDGESFAAGCELNTVVWNTATGGEVLKTPSGLGGRVAFLPKAQLLASNGWSESKLWDLATGKSLGDTPPGVLTAAANGLVLHQKDQSLFLYDPAARRDRHEFKLPLPQPPQLDEFKGKTLFNKVTANCAAVSPNGKALASASQTYLTNMGEGHGGIHRVYDETIHIWDIPTGKLIHKISLPIDNSAQRGRINCLAFSPDGRTLAGGGRTTQPAAQVSPQRKQGTLKGIPSAAVLFWDAGTGKQIHQIEIPRLAGEYEVACLAFAPDGKTLATGGCDTTALVWPLPAVVAGGTSGQK